MRFPRRAALSSPFCFTASVPSPGTQRPETRTEEARSPTLEGRPALTTPTSRRRFLKAIFAATGAGLALACGDDATAPTAPGATSTTTPPSGETRASPTQTTPGAPPAPSVSPSDSPQPVPDALLEAKIAEMIMVGYEGTTMADLDATAQALQDRKVANLVLFDRNVVSPGQLTAFTSGVKDLTANLPLIAIDHEGGFVSRLRPDKGFPNTATALFLGNSDISLTRQYGTAMAQTLRAAGINLNLAPVVDVNVNPESPAIGYYERSFSSDPEAVAEHALAFIRAHHEQGVLTTLKHFAGHGSATEDSHLGITDVTDTWSRDELIPFRRVIEAGEADAVMTAHLVNAQIDPDYPGTLSHATITGILREELGFDGVVITDDMQMGAIRDAFGYDHAIELAILAGADIIAIANMLVYDPALAVNTFNVIVAAVRAGKITEDRIDQSYQRIMRLKARLPA